jgi:thioredoxin-dependent peroxiredoxin
MARMAHSALLVFALFACLPAFISAAEPEKPKSEKSAALKMGDKAPKFEGRTDEDKSWKSTDHVGKKILVVYFYPKDMTPGCTKQACSYRDMQKDFADKEVEVIGVSRDTIASHQEFKKEYDLNFNLLADPDGKIAKAFGVKPMKTPLGELASRWTFVIDRDGKIAYKNEEVEAAKDAEKVLKVIAKLEKADGEKPKAG